MNNVLVCLQFGHKFVFQFFVHNTVGGCKGLVLLS
jgi:hypothetical protein